MVRLLVKYESTTTIRIIKNEYFMAWTLLPMLFVSNGPLCIPVNYFKPRDPYYFHANERLTRFALTVTTSHMLFQH